MSMIYIDTDVYARPKKYDIKKYKFLIPYSMTTTLQIYIYSVLSDIQSDLKRSIFFSTLIPLRIRRGEKKQKKKDFPLKEPRLCIFVIGEKIFGRVEGCRFSKDFNKKTKPRRTKQICPQFSLRSNKKNIQSDDQQCLT